MMSKQDFEAIAAIVAERHQKDDPQLGYLIHTKELVEDLATHFVMSNPRFDKARFTRVCKLKGGF